MCLAQAHNTEPQLGSNPASLNMESDALLPKLQHLRTFVSDLEEETVTGRVFSRVQDIL